MAYEGFAHHSLLIPSEFERGFVGLYRDRTFPEPPIIYVNSPGVTDPSVAPPGCTNLFAVVTSPAEREAVDWANEESRLRDRVLDGLARFGIDVDPKRIDFERVQSPRYFAREHGNYCGSLYGVDEKNRLFGGLFPPSNRDPEYGNLFYCGGSVQPGAGLPMVTLSGRFAAMMI